MTVAFRRPNLLPRNICAPISKNVTFSWFHLAASKTSNLMLHPKRKPSPVCAYQSVQIWALRTAADGACQTRIADRPGRGPLINMHKRSLEIDTILSARVRQALFSTLGLPQKWPTDTMLRGWTRVSEIINLLNKLTIYNSNLYRYWSCVFVSECW